MANPPPFVPPPPGTKPAEKAPAGGDATQSPADAVVGRLQGDAGLTAAPPKDLNTFTSQEVNQTARAINQQASDAQGVTIVPPNSSARAGDVNSNRGSATVNPKADVDARTAAGPRGTAIADRNPANPATTDSTNRTIVNPTNPHTDQAAIARGDTRQQPVTDTSVKHPPTDSTVRPPTIANPTTPHLEGTIAQRGAEQRPANNSTRPARYESNHPRHQPATDSTGRPATTDSTAKHQPGSDTTARPADSTNRLVTTTNQTTQQRDSRLQPPTDSTTGRPATTTTASTQRLEAQQRVAETVAKADLTPQALLNQAADRTNPTTQLDANADRRAIRTSDTSAPKVKTTDAPITPQQTRAQVIADNNAARQNPAKRSDAPTTTSDSTTSNRAKPIPTTTNAGDPGVRMDRTVRTNDSKPPVQPGDSRPPTTRPVGPSPDNTRNKPLQQGDTTPVRHTQDLPGDSRPKLPGQQGDVPPAASRRGPELPGGDRPAKVGGDLPSPLDAHQQKFLADQLAKSPNGLNDPKAQNFKDNFERLSPQNRTNLMNLDGKQQQEMIGKMSQDRVNPALLEGRLAGDKGRQELKIPGLDLADPQNRRFMIDATNRLNQLKLDGTMPNMKVSDALRGLDPLKVAALEKFLTTNANIDGTKLTFGQLDGTRLTQIMKGNFDLNLVGRLSPQDGLHGLNQQFNMGDGRSPLSNIGRTLNDMGAQPGRLSDLMVRTLDTRSMGTGLDLGLAGRMQGDFTTRLNPLQELNVRNMMDNSSKLIAQLDSTMAFGGHGRRADLTSIGLSQVIGTAFGEGRGDFAIRGDFSHSHHHGDAAANAAEATHHGPGKSQDYIAKLPIDAGTGLPYDPSTGKLLDPNSGREIGDKTYDDKKMQDKWDEKDELEQKKKRKHKKDADLEAEAKAKQKAMLLILQAKKKREQELREKQLKDEKQKKEDETRIKYICKDGDTIQSVALKQLRDSRIAPLIYHINKQVIATKLVNGEQVPLLRAGLVIWLPSPKEIREFRSKLVSSVGSAPTQGQKFTSAEEELAARFGAGWAATSKTPPDNAQLPGKPLSEMTDVERKLMEAAMIEAKRRRENIEKALGPITGNTTRSTRVDGEHLTYQVRLGDTLRSVATKHPSIGDVNLWRLIAEVNELSTEVDAKGQPKAGLVRGGKIKIPMATEIADYRQRMGSMAGQPVRDQRVAKNCPKCGRMTVQSASLCPCGHEFEIDKAVTATQPSSKDAATIVMEAINERPREGTRTEDLDSQPTPTTKVGQPTHDSSLPIETRELQERTKEVAAYVESGEWATSKDFEPNCRLTKSALAWDSANGKLTIHLQLRNDENSEWFPILEYEIFAAYSIRYTLARQSGAKKTVKIDLPAAAAMELAQNDLLANWKNYKTKFLE